MGLTLDIFSAGPKNVSLYDYLNKMINFDLVKASESYFCNTCSKNTLADKIYKLYELPNALILTIAFQGEDQDNYLPLGKFMEIDIKSFVEERFMEKNQSHLSLEEDESLTYQLQSVVIYSDVQPCFEGYITFVRDPEGDGWLRYSRYNVERVKEEEVAQL